MLMSPCNKDGFALSDGETCERRACIYTAVSVEYLTIHFVPIYMKYGNCQPCLHASFVIDCSSLASCSAMHLCFSRHRSMMYMYLLIKPLLTKSNVERMEKVPSITAEYCTILLNFTKVCYMLL